MIKRVKDFTRQLIKGRDQLSGNSQKKLDKWRNTPIKKVYIVRKPLMSGLYKLAQFFTKGEFKKDMLKNGYDDMFHLRVDIVLENDVCLTLEKLETVTITRGSKCRLREKDELEHRVIEVNRPITFGEAYHNMTKGFSSKKELYDYDSLKNNCQKFINIFLTKNPAFKYSAEDRAFVNQDVSFLVNKYSSLGKGAKVFTDIAQRLRLFTTGGGHVEERRSLNELILSLSKKY
mgnify:FL=1